MPTVNQRYFGTIAITGKFMVWEQGIPWWLDHSIREGFWDLLCVSWEAAILLSSITSDPQTQPYQPVASEWTSNFRAGHVVSGGETTGLGTLEETLWCQAERTSGYHHGSPKDLTCSLCDQSWTAQGWTRMGRSASWLWRRKLGSFQKMKEVES